MNERLLPSTPSVSFWWLWRVVFTRITWSPVSRWRRLTTCEDLVFLQQFGHKNFIVLWRFELLSEAIRDLGVYGKKMDRKSSNGVTRSGQLLVPIYLYGFERFYTDFFSLPTTSMNNTLVLGYIPNVIFTPILFKQLLKITMSALNFLLQHLHFSDLSTKTSSIYHKKLKFSHFALILIAIKFSHLS